MADELVGEWLLLMEEWGRLGARTELLEGKGRWSPWRRLTVAGERRLSTGGVREMGDRDDIYRDWVMGFGSWVCGLELWAKEKKIL